MGMSPEDRAEYEVQQQKMIDALRRRRMESTAAIKDLFASMIPEDLVTFRRLLHAMVAAEDDCLKMAAYYEGQASAILQHVHHVCPGCGKDHTQEMIEGLLSDDACDSTSALDDLPEGDAT